MKEKTEQRKKKKASCKLKLTPPPPPPHTHTPPPPPGEGGFWGGGGGYRVRADVLDFLQEKNPVLHAVDQKKISGAFGAGDGGGINLPTPGDEGGIPPPP